MTRRASPWRAVAVALAAWLCALPAAAQTAGERQYRVAQLATSNFSRSASLSWTLPFLEKHGYVHGRNLVFDAQVGRPDELPELMQGILARKPDVILAIGGEALRVAGATTKSVPIVGFGPNPVQMGLAQNLARPGGNVTGVVILAAELDAKRLHMLLEVAPQARRIGALVNATSPNRTASERDMHVVAAASQIDLLTFSARGRDDYAAAFGDMRKAGIEALAISADPDFFYDTDTLIAHARDARLAAICQWQEMVRAGCLLSYGPNLASMRSKMGDYVIRIFRGTAPGELAIEQPTDFELSINLKTARELGLDIPVSLLSRADEVIE